MERVPLLNKSEAAAADHAASEALGLTRHLATPRPLYYWADFILSEAIGVTALYLSGTVRWPWRAVTFIVCVLALYRAIVFIHELVHLNATEMKSFRTAWNVLAGIPFLTPLFLYEIHLQHHARKTYGTEGDAEYLPWGMQAPHHILLFPLLSLALPVLATLRF